MSGPRGKQVALRLFDDEVRALDAIVTQLQERPEYAAIRMTRSTVLRWLILDKINEWGANDLSD